MNVPQLRYKPTPFMAEQTHQIAVREWRSQASVMNTLILEAIYARLSPREATRVVYLRTIDSNKL